MTEKSGDLSFVSYTLGLISLVLAFFQPFPGLVLGIIGLVQSKKEKTELSKLGGKLCVWSIILSIIVIIITAIIMIYTYKAGISKLSI